MLAPFREQFRDSVEYMAGPRYGATPGTSSKNRHRQPINPIAQAARTLVANLVPKQPKCKTLARRSMLLAEGKVLTDHINDVGREARLKEVLRTCVTSAFFAPASFVRVGLKAGKDVATWDGKDTRIGDIFIAPFSFDDYYIDPAAQTYRQRGHEGYRHVLCKEYFLSLGVLDGAAMRRFEQLRTIDEERDEDRTASLTQDFGDEETAEDLVEVWTHVLYMSDGTILEVMTPDERCGEEEYLLVTEYEGPGSGPIKRLSFHEVPDQSTPLPPVANMMELAEASDRVAAHLLEMMEEAKTVFAYKRTAADDMARVKRGRNLEGIAVDDIDGIKAFQVNAIIGDLFKSMDFLGAQFNTVSGLLNALAGSSKPGSATEATLDNNNAGVSLGDMQSCVMDFTSEIYEHIGWELIDDPIIDRSAVRRLPGGHAMDVTYSAETRMGDFNQYGFEVEAYSMGPMDPRLRMRSITEYLTVVGALAQTVPNPQALVNLGARELEAPEIADIYSAPIMMGVPGMGAMGMGPGGMPGPGMLGAPGMAPGMAPPPRGGRTGRPIDETRSAFAPAVGGV